MRHHHLSDRDLMLIHDGELPDRRRAAVDAHLAECPLCRTRRTELHGGAELTTSFYRSTQLDDEAIAASRERLRSRLADITRRQQAPIIERILVHSWRWAAAGVAAVVVVLLGRAVTQFDAPSDAIERDALPIVSLTPGATWNVTVDELCSPAPHEQRQVPTAIRAEVLQRYRMERVPADQYELDYLITPELGGAPTVQNLWPQRYSSRTWNAHVKDQLERLLPQLVCDGAVSLHAAQQDIARDWIAAYKKYLHTDVPLRLHAQRDDRPLGSRDDDLVYPIWRPGSPPTLRLVSLSTVR